MPVGIPVEFARQTTVGATPNIADLAFAVFEKYAKDKVAQTQRYVAHPGVRRFILHAEAHSGGPKRTDIRLKETNTAKFVSPFEVTPNVRKDVMGHITDDIKHVEASYVFDDKEDAFTSGSETRINDHLKQQYNSTMIDSWDFTEAAFWNGPLNSSDNTAVVGMAFHLPTLAAGVESDGTFGASTARYSNGTSTTQTIQGRDLTDTDNARLIRWAATYNGEVDETLFAIIAKANLNTRFQFVPGLKQTLGDAGSQNQKYMTGGAGLFVPSKQFLQFIDYANKKIRNGSDSEVAMMFREIMVDGNVVIHTPYLDNFTDEPLFAINSEELAAYVLGQRVMKWLPPFRYGVEQWKLACVSSFLVHGRNPRQQGYRIHKKFA